MAVAVQAAGLTVDLEVDLKEAEAAPRAVPSDLEVGSPADQAAVAVAVVVELPADREPGAAVKETERLVEPTEDTGPGGCFRLQSGSRRGRRSLANNGIPPAQ